ncbi:hypothetical protein Sste5346_001125 [Sporothrix stenoceras]|uniref:Uncharacterized protein n=1 Tax=Sporothrix stenoceras TaxID=5173 RepID=A0ABR3ZSA4_9PEZI
MKSFTLKPVGTGSTNKSHKSHKSQSLSISSSTGSSSSSTATSVVSSSLAHAKSATSAAWSACKQGTRTTLKKGSSAFKGNSVRKSHSPPSPALDWNQGQPRTYSPPRRVRRLFRFGGASPIKKSRYHSLSEDMDTDDDRDIFSGRPFSERVDVHLKEDNDDHYYANDIDHMDAGIARFVFTPQHAATSYLATSTAQHMQFAADEGEGDDDEWWRD